MFVLSDMCVIGYANNQKGYKCYHHPTHKTYSTMDGTSMKRFLF